MRVRSCRLPALFSPCYAYIAYAADAVMFCHVDSATMPRRQPRHVAMAARMPLDAYSAISSPILLRCYDTAMARQLIAI